MRKSMLDVNWFRAIMFTGLGMVSQSVSAQAPVYTASDYVKSSAFRQTAVYQDNYTVGSDAKTQLYDQSSAGPGYNAAVGCAGQSGGGAECGYGDFGCDEQKWTANADALFLFRSDPAPSVLAVNPNRPNERFDASDFDFGLHTGYELALQGRFGNDDSIELRYFGLDHWRSTFDGQTTPNELLQFNSAVPVFALSGTGVTADYGSKLHNTEINLSRYYGDCVRLLTGFRYLELDERGSASLVNSLIPFNYVATTRNRLYGGQLGAQGWLICRDGFSWDVVGKAGIYGNAAAQDSTVSTGVATLNANGRGGQAAFVGEIGTNGAYCLSNNLSLRGGYRLLWIDGVALASDQLASTDFFNGNGFNDSGSVFYHGATAGLELAY